MPGNNDSMSEYDSIRAVLADFGLFLTRLNTHTDEIDINVGNFNTGTIAGKKRYDFSGQCDIGTFYECSKDPKLQLYLMLRDIDLSDPVVKDQYEKFLTVIKLKDDNN